MPAIHDLAKHIAPGKQSVPALPTARGMRLTRGQITALNSDGTVQVKLDVNGTAIKADCLFGAQGIAINANAEVLQFGNRLLVIGVRSTVQDQAVQARITFSVQNMGTSNAASIMPGIVLEVTGGMTYASPWVTLPLPGLYIGLTNVTWVDGGGNPSYAFWQLGIRLNASSISPGSNTQHFNNGTGYTSWMAGGTFRGAAGDQVGAYNQPSGMSVACSINEGELYVARLGN